LNFILKKFMRKRKEMFEVRSSMFEVSYTVRPGVRQSEAFLTGGSL